MRTVKSQAEAVRSIDMEVYGWVQSTLINDENASDSELMQHFVIEGRMTPNQARHAVSQRGRAMRNPFDFVLEM